MGARVHLHNALRSPVRSEAREREVASGPRPEAILALLAIVLLLMSGPAFVAGLYIVNSHLLDGVRGWIEQPGAWLSYLSHARLILVLPLVSMVARAKEDL